MPMSAAERAWCLVVPHHPAGAGQARHGLAAELTSIIRPELLGNAVAVLGELVGNAVRHGDPLPGGVIRVAWRVRWAGGAEIVDLRVTDGGAATEPRLRDGSLDATDGRGLAIVEALANSWGVERDDLGQSVWAEVSWPSHQPATV